jgi:NADPH:quinone reductase-like Zn-dependent oxidoreductase
MEKEMMRAVLLSEPTQGKEVKFTECKIPEVKAGWVLVKIKAFGMNHSEQILRQHEIKADYIRKPIIPGIECVGEIADASYSSFVKGQRVISLMGGMGRSFNGSYAEYALLPAHHVFAVNSDLSWEQLGAVPETYYTAWGSLFEGLNLQSSDTLLVRGATCALGYAAIQLGKALGCKVVATTHKEGKLQLLRDTGADEILIDEGILKGKTKGITKILELVGARTVKDSLLLAQKGGIVCHTGILGGVFTLNGFDPIKDIPNGVYLTGFYSNYPTQNTIDNIFCFLTTHKLSPCIGKVFDFDQINIACEALESGTVNGKIVVSIRA